MPQRLTASRSFDRIEGEPPKAFEAFVCYRNMGPGRSIAELSIRSGKNSRTLFEWSSDWNWVERCGTWDNLLAAKAQEVAESYLPMWEQRRQVALEKMMLLSAKLLSKAEAMLDHPLTKEMTRESADGKTIYNIIEPAGWTWAGLATVVRVGSELQAATIAEGLAEDPDDDFDPDTATEDQLRERLKRLKARAQLRTKAVPQ